MAYQYAPAPALSSASWSQPYGGASGGLAAAPSQMRPAPTSSIAAVPATSVDTGNTSISQLVQALQSGNINKQQLYSSLASMYKGQTPNALPASLAASPSTANSSFNASFSLNTTQPASQPFQDSFATTVQQTTQPHQYTPSHSQHQSQSHPFPSFASHPNAAPAAPTYSAQAKAAQQHIQSFLSKHLNQSHLSLSLAASQAPNESLNLSLSQNISLSDLQPNNQSSLNFSGVQASPPQHHQQQYAPYDQSRLQQPQFSPVSNEYGHAPASSPSGLESLRTGALDDSMAGRPYDADGADGEAEEYLGDSASYFGSSPSSVTSRQDHAQQHGGSSSHRGNNSARQSVRARMAQVYTDEANRELTFKPSITPMPKGLYAKTAGNSDAAAAAPFLGRVMHWHENKRARERQRSADLESQSLAECSFKPQLTAETIAIVEAPGASHRRLFSARSTARAKILELEVRRKEEEAFRANCTFEPELNRKSLAIATNPTTQRRPLTSPTPADAVPLGISSSARDLAECTFQPKVNTVPSGMLAANLYLEQNAFERLASAKTKPHSGRDRSSEDGYSSDGGSARGRRMSGKTNSSKRSSSQDSRGANSQDASFSEFLARLKYKEFQRGERLAALRLEEQQQHQYGRPMLSKTSARIVQKSMEDGRYQSPAKHAAAVASARAAGEAVQDLVPAGSPSAAQQRESAARAARIDPECTFTPTINPYSSSLSRRSAHEMSHLELVRRAHNLELAANERLAAEMEEVSFSPHLKRSKSHASVDSRLKVVSEPDLYLERLEFQRQMREAEIQRQKQIREEAESKECTFTPAVHESPAYVKRIARSMSVTRGHDSSQATAAARQRKGVKPDWK